MCPLLGNRPDLDEIGHGGAVDGLTSTEPSGLSMGFRTHSVAVEVSPSAAPDRPRLTTGNTDEEDDHGNSI